MSPDDKLPDLQDLIPDATLKDLGSPHFITSYIITCTLSNATSSMKIQISHSQGKNSYKINGQLGSVL